MYLSEVGERKVFQQISVGTDRLIFLNLRMETRLFNAIGFLFPQICALTSAGMCTNLGEHFSHKSLYDNKLSLMPEKYLLLINYIIYIYINKYIINTDNLFRTKGRLLTLKNLREKYSFWHLALN